MKYSYFPGCSMEASGKEYHKSLTYVNRVIGLELLEIDDWNCCGASSGLTISRELELALPARNLALAEAQYPQLDIAIPCAACYSRMKGAAAAARSKEAAKLARLIEMPLSGQVEVVSLLEAYSSPAARAAISAAIKKPLTGLKVACYYGCLYARPLKITGVKNTEELTNMDELLSLAGATTCAWAFKTECCGADHHMDLPIESKPLLYRIYKNARASGAKALAVACPMCMMNLDMQQAAVNKAYDELFDLPVYFFTELLAVAMGAGYKECGISSHFHPAMDLLQGLDSGQEVM